MNGLHQLSFVEQQRRMSDGSITSRELIAHYLERIDRYNPTLGAFTTVTAERAIQQAQNTHTAQATSSEVNHRLLAGLPTADKDLNNRIGVATSHGSKAATKLPAATQDEITDALDKAGLISMGKTHSPEFGLTGNAISDLGYVCRNPWDLNTDPGGSSSGAAVAVAAGLLPVAIGSDAGGSIRIPAASTGCVGIKPTRQFFSFDGQRASNRNIVHGPIARNISDAALFLDGLTTPKVDIDNAQFYQSSQRPALATTRRLRIAVSTYSPWQDHFRIDPPAELLDHLDQVAKLLEDNGHRVERIEVPEFRGYSKAFMTLWQKGASEILVHSSREQQLTAFTQWLRARGKEYGDHDVDQAQRTLEQFESFYLEHTAEYDAVLTPALGLLPQTIAWHDDPDPASSFEKQCLYSPYTSFVNITGQPAIVLPSGLSESGLPLSVQLIGQHRQEHELIRLAALLEAELGWGNQFPPNFA